MKICKLKIKNLNSFREPVEINFEESPLDDASLIAITGPTGAGKTTLLDAICVALYGKTPRLDKTKDKNQHSRNLISHGEAEGFAEVYFEADNTRYHATWSIKREGPPKARLFDASGELITTKVAQKVKDILGLDFDAFRRSVMLAQGDFAAFLKASMDERRNILEATAGVSIYDDLKKALNDKVNEVEDVHNKIKAEIDKIPGCSREEVIDAETELDRLQDSAKRLGEEVQQTQEERARETKRADDFEKLQNSEERREELLAQKPEIDALQEERENANRAKGLLLEKREFDNAKSELEKSEESLRVATTEKTDAETQVKGHQTIYNEKAAAYKVVSEEEAEKMPVYTEAKADVERAGERLAQADQQTPKLVAASDALDALENQLSDRRTEQTELQEQIDDTQRFLEDNPLPSDRQTRLNRVTGLLAELASDEKQLDAELEDKADAEKKVSALKKEIDKLSDTREEKLSEKEAAAATLASATTELDALLATGTPEEWTNRRQQASKAQPIAQGYEKTQEDLADTENQLNALNERASELKAELEQLETDLESQSDVCQQAAEVVKRCEREKESAQWAAPINQLRQRLHPGEPCAVCGATDHPHADVVEPGAEERLQQAEAALTAAKAELDAAQTERQTLETKKIQMTQDKSNIADQIETSTAEIKTLQDDASELLTQWQAVYPDADVSATWVSEQLDLADTAIANIAAAKQTHTQSDGAFQMVSQKLENCEKDIAGETNALNDTETQLDGLNNTIADLQANIEATADSFWQSMPDTFHGVTPKAAVDQLEEKIKTVEVRETELSKAAADIRVLNANITADESKLQGLKENHETLKNEKDEYLRERETFLDAARQKTGGLETEAEIDKAIDALADDLQAKADARDSAEQQLQDSRDLLTQKQATHKLREEQFDMSAEKLDESCQVYDDKLAEAGFDTAEAHDNAFRDDDQIQDLTNRIDAHEDELQRLVLDITALQTRFEEKPYDPDALDQIEIQLEEINARFQQKQKEIGAQEEIIKGLKDALKKREALANKLYDAEQEMERWQRLKGIIPHNTLRDFALEIMFKQMVSLANEQLKYLTLERYQLKVESIGNLAVIDRWNANEKRPVQTLSGGESFLTSLALALALSELSSGRAQLNSLFLDEGFGTLDSETLDTAIAALEGLRMQGRSIFLISHIKELTRRLPVKIEVRKKGNGSSSVDVRV